MVFCLCIKIYNIMPKVSVFTGFRELKLSTKRIVQSLFYNYSENNKAKNTKPIIKIKVSK